jgi:hypothetical protein
VPFVDIDISGFLVFPGRISPRPIGPLIDAAFYLQRGSDLQYSSSIKSVRMVTTESMRAMADIGIGEKCA